MSALPKYLEGTQARFDFRISNGLGVYCEPDWEDPNLKVEFYDGAGILRFTATKTSNPPLAKSNDREGVFLYMEGIDLTNFALGVCTARIFCQINNEPVLPYPTVLEAFQVVSGPGPEPVYTTVDNVKKELPSELPAQLTDQLIAQYIYDASRRIDAFLYGYYSVPFPGIEGEPKTPALIERLCRKLAVSDGLVFLGLANELELKPALEEKVVAELMRLRKGELQVLGYRGPLSVYQGSLYQEEYPGEVLDL